METETVVYCVGCGARVVEREGMTTCGTCGRAFRYEVVAAAGDEMLPYATRQTDRPTKTPTNRWCAWALGVSLGSCLFPVVGIAAIALAAVGLVRVGRTRERGVGNAVGAIALSIIGTAVFLLVWLGPSIVKPTALRAQCQSNLRTLGQTMLFYENDFHGATGYTMAEAVAHVDLPGRATTMVCPSLLRKRVGVTRPPSYVMLPRLRPLVRLKNASQTVIAFELGMHHIPRSGAPESESVNVLFGDGHVEAMEVEDAVVAIERSLSSEDGATTRPAEGK